MCRIIVLGSLISVHYHVIVSMSKNDARGNVQLLLFCCVIADSIIIIIMYIYHVFINALSTHMIHIININIFCTHVEHSPTKTIYINYNTEKQTHTHYTHTHTHTHTHTQTH